MSKTYRVITKKLFRGSVFYMALPFLILSCNKHDYDQEIDKIGLERVGGVVVNDSTDQISEILGGLQIVDDSDVVYGVDLRIGRAYKLSLITGDVNYLVPKGRGPKELNQPVQMIMKDENEFYIYDHALDVIAKHKNGGIVEKFTAYSDHNVWPRNLYGYYVNGAIITAIEDPSKVRSMDFENARPLAFLDFKKNTLLKKGVFSPTLDNLDADEKYPVIHFDSMSRKIYYVFKTDYTIMEYDIDKDKTSVLNSYLPTDFRIRSTASKGSTSGNIDTAKSQGLDRSIVMGVERIKDQLVVVWHNFNEEFYENTGDFSAGNVDYFGVLYDLPELENPREFSLPGRFFGIYQNKLLIEEDYGSNSLKVGFYEFTE